MAAVQTRTKVVGRRLDSECASHGTASQVGHEGSACGGFVSVKGLNIQRRPLQAQQKPPEQTLTELSSEVRLHVIPPFPPRTCVGIKACEAARMEDATDTVRGLVVELSNLK